MEMKMKSLLACTITLLLVAVPVSAAPLDLGMVEAVPCPVKLPYETEKEGRTYDCGIVVVPENHDDPEGRSIELAWLRLQSTGEATESDPLIYPSGGPGASALHELATIPQLHQNLQPAREPGDIILFDQRGTTSPGIAGLGANLLGLPERDFVSQGALWSINCQEDIGFNPPEVAQAFIAATPYPGLLTQSLDTYRRFHEVCGHFPQSFTRE
jgi:hypothetical protein